MTTTSTLTYEQSIGLQLISSGDFSDCSKRHLYELLLAGLIEYHHPIWQLTSRGLLALTEIPHDQLSINTPMDRANKLAKWKEIEQHWIQAKSMVDVAQIFLDGQMTSFLQGQGKAPEMAQHASMDELRQCEERARMAMDSFMRPHSPGNTPVNITTQLKQISYKYPRLIPKTTATEGLVSFRRGSGRRFS